MFGHNRGIAPGDVIGSETNVPFTAAITGTAGPAEGVKGLYGVSSGNNSMGVDGYATGNQSIGGRCTGNGASSNGVQAIAAGASSVGVNANASGANSIAVLAQCTDGFALSIIGGIQVFFTEEHTLGAYTGTAIPIYDYLGNLAGILPLYTPAT